MGKLKIVLLLSVIVFAGVFNTVSAQHTPFSVNYTGGDDSLYVDFKKNMIYPPVAKRNRIQGTVIVSVDLESDGHFSRIQSVKSLNGGCTAEALRLVKELQNSGKIIAPGYKATYQIPVIFKL